MEPSVERERMRRAIEQNLLGTHQDPVQLGRFVVLELIGTGGMGRVYRAFDPKLERVVAIKIVRTRTETDRARLEDEARALAKLTHPNVVAIHDVGESGADVFIAMDYIAGGTLDAWSRANPGRIATLVGYFEQAASGLIAAHEAGLVHRDLKPGNILIDGERVCLADFGLAISDREEPTATVAGTPGYMATRAAPRGGGRAKRSVQPVRHVQGGVRRTRARRSSRAFWRVG